jgi:hypothetical protein
LLDGGIHEVEKIKDILMVISIKSLSYYISCDYFGLFRKNKANPLGLPVAIGF